MGINWRWGRRFLTKLPVIFTQDRIIRVLRAIFALGLALLLFCVGGYIGQKYYQPQVVAKYGVVTLDRVVETVVYTPIEKVIETIVYEPVKTIVYEPVEKPVIKEIIKEIEVPRQLLQFENLAELEQWLSNVKLIDIRFDVVDQVGNSIRRFDCDDYARRLQDKALGEGYIMSFEVIHYKEYNSLFREKKIPTGTIHAINSVIIGNKVYYIEPQTQEIVFVANLD